MHMLGPASSAQTATDLSITDGMALRALRFARLSAVLVCGVAVLLVVGVAPAFAVSKLEKSEAESHSEHFEYYPSGIEERTDECDGVSCHEGKPSVVPPGEYLESTAAGQGIRVLEYGEHDCFPNESKVIECEPFYRERPEKSSIYLAPGYKELEQTIVSGGDSEYAIREQHLIFIYAWKPVAKPNERFGPKNEAEPERKYCSLGYPVNCATGNQVVTQTDLAVGGRGPTLGLTRTYNSLLAVKQATPGQFGYGWTGPYSAHLELNDKESEATAYREAVVYQNNGSTVTFDRGTESEAWTAPSSLVEATLADEGSGYVYTLPDQTKLHFNSSGVLTSEEDRNGNAITFAYNAEKQLESATDGAGRKLTFKYNGSGEVESVTDPMDHTVKYTYESGNLVSVTQPGETKIRWKFKYNAAHELTSETDGREHTVTTEYNEAHQVSSQTDAMSRKRTWKYATAPENGTETTIIEPNGSETVEQFNEDGSPTSITHAAGTSIAATTTYEYNEADELVAVTDPNKHKTEYAYDAAGNKISEKNADGDETKWKYDSAHDIETETTPDGETTTIKRNADGDPEVIERPAPGSATQKTTYKYATNGDVESMTNPLEHTWKYEYDSYGDRKAETDPEGNKRTWEYNEDSQETSSVSPRGNAEGAEASKFTTKIERNAKGQPLKITDPLSHTTKYTYDGDGNVETTTDGNSHKTTYTYNDDNEQIKVKEANGTVTETEYDSMGQVTSQTDGNKHVTKYVRNLLEEVEEVVNPLGKKTLKEYDAAGNLIKLTDPKGRTTTYTYDPANRLAEVVYSSGNPATIKYEYNKDGDRTKMTDGTGTTKYEYDQLDRMTESENGNKEVIKYEYNLGNLQTKITYPNGKAVEHAYDKDGRLEKITDWNSKVIKFSYNADSEFEKTTFPSETKDEDTYAYNDADQMSEVKMKKSSETLGSLVYTRDDDGQVKKTTSKDLPGTETVEDTYDENNRLTKSGGTEYKYDSANNPTTEGSSTNTFNEGDELEKGTGVTYSYDELGERTKTTPEKGGATTYGYDQAGNLISVERPEKESVPKIEDSYTYNGEDLRTSQTISGTTTYMAWDMAEELPLILSDGTNSYIYGPGGLPVEQINNSTGTTLYLHHDQQGSTRLLTGSTGKNEGAYTYTPYGAVQEHTGTATTPLGYDGQYTSSDSGLIYLRTRVYDPATAQFLTVDPLAQLTRAPYTYAQDNPLNRADPTGLCTGFGPAPAGCTGGPGELGPHVFCEPTKQETEEAERKGSHVNPLESLEEVGKWIIKVKEEGREWWETHTPQCQPSQFPVGETCQRKPPESSPGPPSPPSPVPVGVP
jgi:RHS repeat-associated protein